MQFCAKNNTPQQTILSLQIEIQQRKFGITTGIRVSLDELNPILKIFKENLGQELFIRKKASDAVGKGFKLYLPL